MQVTGFKTHAALGAIFKSNGKHERRDGLDGDYIPVHSFTPAIRPRNDSLARNELIILRRFIELLLCFIGAIEVLKHLSVET